MPMLAIRLFLLFICCMLSLFPCDAWGGKQGQENPDLPRSITLRARVVKNYIVTNQAKAQIRYDDDSCRPELYEPTFIYEFQRLSSQTPFSSISFIYEDNGFVKNTGEECIFYGKNCGKGELLLPETNIIYIKPYLHIEDNIHITEYREQHKEELSYYLFPFGVSIKNDDPIRFYYPYAGMISNGNDIKGAEQVYFALKGSLSSINLYRHGTKISRDFHSDLVSEGINFLEIGQEAGIKISERSDKYRGPTRYHRSVFDIPEEQGISAGAALCGGYAKFEYMQSATEGTIKQVYKSFRYTHPRNHPDLVDILFVQDLDHDTLPKLVDIPLQVDESVKLLNDYLLSKLQEAFQEKIQFQQDLIESDEQGHITKALSPFWKDIQSSLVATAKFIDEHPLLADLTINGLQFIMGGPLKFALIKIANYLAGDLIENSKEKAQQFLAEQLGVPPDQIELATAVIGMSVDLFLSQPGNVLKSAKKVIEAAEKRAIKRNFKYRNRNHNFSLKHDGEPFQKSRSSLSSLDLAQKKGLLKTQKKLKVSHQYQPGKTLIPSLDLAAGRAAKKSFVRTEKKALLAGEGKVGTYGELRGQSYGSKIHAHHMPSQRFMSDQGIKPSEGITFNMSAERHMQTRTFGKKQELHVPARKTLADDIKDAKKIYKKDDLYSPEIRGGLQEHIKKSKVSFPEIFKKDQK